MAEAEITKQVIRVSQRTKENAVYWRTYQYDKEKPTVLFIAAFPTSGDLNQLDLTTMLILNNCRQLGFGTITIGNLFSIPTKYPSDRNLVNSIASDGIRQLVKLTLDVDEVIVGIGSLLRKSKVAAAQLDEYLGQAQELEVSDKVKYLVSGNPERNIHPLGCQGETWRVR